MMFLSVTIPINHTSILAYHGKQQKAIIEAV